MYYLYSIRSNGWFTNTATYSTDIKQAREFTREAALTLVAKHRDQGAHRMLPVRKEDVV